MKAILLFIAFLFAFLQSHANDFIRLEIKVPDVVKVGDKINYRTTDNKSFDAAVRQIIKFLPEARQPETKDYEYIRPENIQYILDAMNWKSN
ncbi:hypothetical protein M2451_001740 [Dysgonomonas sp. PFB1-18]|uniref:hypothetical protein n=1 Tax=unclassified Dysgonomonas TaxID=2630389 RepID=UPI0024767404|nr:MULTISPECIES: hypothetical protein [unclassified Dysgonomonas]MDH6309169.1 hypothetical protein [Dysgonomonas sp. PF1-14]MDH6338951.1 hypothetical protein [Dysgonomonas sp. PF1-16]MDH6380418.1 hypothetical protein [Dysgonomonas sp. PFB1-18]MDH6397779.1 hypothetical protein [Dysgonomonas sp. PF1-23]